MSFRDGFSGGMAGFNYMQDQQNMRRDQRRQDEGDQMRRTDYADKQSRQAQDDNMAKVGRISAMIVAAPTPEARASIYASAKGHLGGFAQEHGLNLPDAWDESLLDEVRSMSQMLGQGGSGQPPGLREFQGMTQGFSPEEVAQAQRVKAGITAAAGTQSNAPFTALKYTDGQGRDVVESFDKRSGAASAPGASAEGPKMPPNMMDFLSNVQTLGGRVTSGYRTPEEQAALRAAGKTTTRRSQHNDSTGADVVFPNPQLKAQAIAYAQANGINVLDEGTHTHFGIPRGTLDGANPYASRSAEDQAALNAGATDQAKVDVTLANAPAVNANDAANAAAKAKAEVIAKAQGQSQVDLPGTIASAEQLVGVINQALSHPGLTAATGLSSKLDPRNKTPGTDAFNFNVLSAQIQGKAFLEAFNSLRGGGSITEKEGAAATAAIARLNTAQSQEAYVQALQELRGIVRNGQARARAKAGNASADNAGQSGRLKFNPSTGRIE